MTLANNPISVTESVTNESKNNTCLVSDVRLETINHGWKKSPGSWVCLHRTRLPYGRDHTLRTLIPGNHHVAFTPFGTTSLVRSQVHHLLSSHPPLQAWAGSGREEDAAESTKKLYISIPNGLFWHAGCRILVDWKVGTVSAMCMADKGSSVTLPVNS